VSTGRLPEGVGHEERLQLALTADEVDDPDGDGDDVGLAAAALAATVAHAGGGKAAMHAATIAAAARKGSGSEIEMSSPPPSRARNVPSPRKMAWVPCARPAISLSTRSGYSARYGS
jgi:hypothetical protein